MANELYSPFRRNHIHHLQYLPHKDAAHWTRTGMNFQRIRVWITELNSSYNWKIKVWTTFDGYDEWEKDSEQIMEVEYARKLWKSLIKSGEYRHV